MTWWYWILLGLGLTLFELVTPGGLFAIFFAVAAIVVGLLDLVGIGGPDWVQWVLFSVLALASLALFRRPLLARLRLDVRGKDVDSLTGEVVSPLAPIAPGEVGRAELRGSTWSARNVAAAAVTAGQRCRVVAVHGLELDIRPE
jgi:membrane protein implicated in regulation of membrane protease activity